eukprot:jgi/Botrbrau1/19774/Bobra.0124s0026.1
MSTHQPTDTLYIGNLDQKVTRRLLYEICIQAGPVVRLDLPEDPAGGHRGFGFCEYEDVESAIYAFRLFQGLVTLHGKALRFRFSPGSTRADTASV